MNETAKAAIDRAMAAPQLDPTSEKSVRAAVARVIEETGAAAVATPAVAGLATRLVLSEGLLGAMGRANDELGAEIERLKAENERWAMISGKPRWAVLGTEAARRQALIDAVRYFVGSDDLDDKRLELEVDAIESLARYRETA